MIPKSYNAKAANFRFAEMRRAMAESFANGSRAGTLLDPKMWDQPQAVESFRLGVREVVLQRKGKFREFDWIFQLAWTLRVRGATSWPSRC